MDEKNHANDAIAMTEDVIEEAGQRDSPQVEIYPVSLSYQPYYYLDVFRNKGHLVVIGGSWHLPDVK